MVVAVMGGDAAGAGGRVPRVRASSRSDVTSRTSTTSYFIHHSQRIALASIVGDAWQIRRSITERKMRLNAASNHDDVMRKRNDKSAKSKKRTPSGGVSAGVA